MRLSLNTPTELEILDITDSELESLKRLLTFKDRSIEMQAKNMKKNVYLRMRYGDDWVESKVKELTDQMHKCLVFQKENKIYTYSGLQNIIAESFKITDFANKVFYPEFKTIPWAKVPSKEMRYYQKEALEGLLSKNHSHVELPTGSGKSIVLMTLAKGTGLKTVIMTPSTSIAEQLYKECVEFIGKKYVGFFGGSKKQTDKLITIAIAQSLVRIDKGSNPFKEVDVLIVDESHSVAADTLDDVCQGVLGGASYRWFLSATQERADGKDLLLMGNIGPQVYRKGIQELQDQGFLAKISTLIYDVNSNSSFKSDNIIKMNQKHLYANDQIAREIAMIANQAIARDMPTLILVDEHSQEELLRNYLTIQYAYACGNSDVTQICEDFNAGKLMCVVGTSAVSTGTNFIPVKLTISWQANKASTKIKQGAIGRSTRISENKKEVKIIDFRIVNVPQLKRHADIRAQYYAEVGPVMYTEKLLGV